MKKKPENKPTFCSSVFFAIYVHPDKEAYSLIILYFGENTRFYYKGTEAGGIPEGTI